MNKDVEDLRDTVTLLTRAVTELLLWTEQAEASGSVPRGAMSRARDLLELERVQGDIAMIRETLSILEANPVSLLRQKLTDRVSKLEAQIETLQKRIHSA